jgi:hypothetical protein
MTNLSLELLEKAEEMLRDLPCKVVFMGGVTVALHLDDPAAKARPTKDIDFVVEATTYSEVAILEEELRQLGFYQDPIVDGPICRWHKDGLMLDMIPTNPIALGFDESKWFSRGYESSQAYTLPNGVSILAFDPLHLLATKIAAYHGRGQNDWLASQDVEDIVTVLDGRRSICDELNTDGTAQDYIKTWIFSYPEDEFRDILGAHLSDYNRGIYLYNRLKSLRQNH